MESKRQQQIGKMIQQALSDVFQLKGTDIYGRAFVTISGVNITPDLQIARVYLSIFNVEDKQEILDNIHANGTFLRKKVGEKIRKKIKHIPMLEFYMDDTLDTVFEMDNLFEKIKKEDGSDNLNEAISNEEE